MSEHVSSRERIVSTAFFIAVVALFMFVSHRAGMRALGVATLVSAVVSLRSTGIPYGIEGRKPAGHLTGVPKVLFCIALGATGTVMLVAPDLVLRFFGWV